MITIELLLKQVDTKPGATAEEIASVERDLGCRLPNEFKEVLRMSNGFEGSVDPEGYLNFWSTERILSANRTIPVAEILPGAVLIGTDGSGTSYGFRWRGEKPEYFSVPSVPIELEFLIVLGDTFLGLVERARLGTDLRSEA
jgi:hypothetical protein